jgi:RNA polymerase sigma-70 factor, ECF subfamily
MIGKNKEKLNMNKSRECHSDFEIIYTDYFTPLFRYILSQTKNQEVTEDLIQNVFLKVLKQKNDKNCNDFPPLPYFFTIARNTVIDYWKKKKEISTDISGILFSSLIDKQENPQERLEKETRLNNLKKALEKLTFEQKEVLTLRFISDISNKEISQTLGKSEEAIRQIQYRAIKKLREIIYE